MASKKTLKTKKKVTTTKKVFAKKPKTSGKTVSAKKKVAKKPVKTVTAKKPKTAQTKTKGTKIVETSRTVEVKKIVETKTKKKLSPKEKKIQEIKKNLQMQRNALLAEAEVALNLLPGQTIFPDLGDQASAEVDRNFMLRLREREQRLLKKIEAAIEKIETGTFGICEICGQGIEIKRLEARPVTTMCIICKTEQEEEEKLKEK